MWHSSVRLAVTAVLVLMATPSLAQTVGRDDNVGVVTMKVAPPVTGEQVYVQICQACHMANAQGGMGAATIPALAKNPHLAVAAYPISMVLRGRGAMPSLADLLSPSQIANVVTYIRTHFGNDYSKPVTQADVMRLAQPTAAQ